MMFWNTWRRGERGEDGGVVRLVRYWTDVLGYQQMYSGCGGAGVIR